MKYAFTLILFTFAILAFYYATRIFYKVNRNRKSQLYFTIMSLGSGLWSLGYALMLMVSEPFVFYVVRGIGVSGLFIFLSSGILMLSIIGGYQEDLKIFIYLEILVGINIFCLVIMPGAVSLKSTAYGTVTEFNSPTLSIIYTSYTVLMAISFAALSVHMVRKGKQKSIQAFGRYFLVLEAIILVGMVIDTILPAMGINYNIPASSMLQFIGLIIVYYAIHKLQSNEINLANMVGYVYNSVQSPMIVFDPQNNVKIYNKMAGEMLDLDANDKITINVWRERFHMDPPQGIGNTKETVILDTDLERKSMCLRLYVDPLYNEYGDFIGYITLVSDTTLTTLYTQELEKAKNAAIDANRSKSMFLANMSHEIRTPMNSILSFAKLALEENPTDSDREYFMDIRDSAESLLAIINDILDISKIESGKMELVEQAYETEELFHEINLIMSMQAESKGLRYISNIDPEIPKVLHGDKGKLREVFINLVNNAVKYTKEGSVTFNVRLLSNEKGKASIEAQVIDTGIGIKAEELPKIFDSFSRVDQKLNSTTEGTGLGLAITKGIAELMGGDVSVTSKYGEGSVFTFIYSNQVMDDRTLEADKEKEKSMEGKALSLEGVKMLAVDDNMTNIKVVSKILTRYGAEFMTCYSGREAIDLCRVNHFDVILMDQMMPEMDGITAMQEIRKLGGIYRRDGECKIIALTANVIEGVKEQLLELGFDAFLGKPIDFKEFDMTVSKFAGRLVNQAEAPADQTEPQILEEKAESNESPKIDYQKGLENYGGFFEDYAEIAAFVISTAQEDLDELLGYYNDKDYENFVIKVHGMKSQGNYLGGTYIGEKAKALEFAGKENRISDIDAWIVDFPREYMEFTEELQAYLDSHKE